MRSPHTARKSSPHSPQLEKACVQQGRPNAAKKNKKTKKTINWADSFSLHIHFNLSTLAFTSFKRGLLTCSREEIQERMGRCGKKLNIYLLWLLCLWLFPLLFISSQHKSHMPNSKKFEVWSGQRNRGTWFKMNYSPLGLEGANGSSTLAPKFTDGRKWEELNSCMLT